MMLSVIIPTYNCSAKIKKIIYQALKISACDVEIIIIDDGSTEESLKILKQIKNYNGNIRIIYNKHKGVSVARNTGIKYAKGEYITFADDDDSIVYSMYDKLIYTAIEFNNPDIISASVKVNQKHAGNVYYQKTVKNDLLLNSLKISTNEFVFNEYPTGPIGKLFYRQTLIDNDLCFPVDVFNGEDLIFNCHVLLNSKKVVLMSGHIYTYINSDFGKTSLMHSYFPEMSKNNQRLFEYVVDVVNRMNIPDSQKKEIKIYWHVRLLITNIVRQYSVKVENPKEYQKDISMIKKYFQKKDIEQLISKKFSMDQKILLYIVKFSPKKLILFQVRVLRFLKELKKRIVKENDVKI